MKEVIKYSNCFVCGDKNPIGLKAKFWQHEDKVTSSLKADELFEGYRGIYHGGIIATMLDEVMIKAVLAEGVYAVTAEMTIRYKRPVEIGTELQFIGKITERKGRVYTTKGEVADTQGNVYAIASGKYIRAASELKNQLASSLEKPST